MRAPGGVYEVADSSAGMVVVRSREGGRGPQARVRALTRLRVSARSPPRSAARWARARPARLRRAIGGRGGRGLRWLAADVQRAAADVARAVEVALEDGAAARERFHEARHAGLALAFHAPRELPLCVTGRVCKAARARAVLRRPALVDEANDVAVAPEDNAVASTAHCIIVCFRCGKIRIISGPY
ncbi:hypothetical protein T492DRAFT_337094 [Pavlovales sp. CCMP2436]|nr:hypothetical protein T492DRAFT_337094 [Pavlovales sp. CCMP2436]